MRIYSAVLAALVLLAFGAVRLAYAHGELVHVSASTGSAPAPMPSAPVTDRLSVAWHSSDRPAGGDPYDDGVVVTFDAHTVNGRDARTGAVRWHYTRSDETICSVLQQDSSTIAIYDRHGDCDEVTGFTTSTGVAKWYRTLMDDGSTVTASAPNVVVSVAQHSVHVIDNAGGLDRWNWVAPDGCSVSRALAGTQGVLISLACAGEHRLVLRDLTADTLKWMISTPGAMVPIAAGASVAAVNPDTGTVHGYTVAKGAQSIIAQLPATADFKAAAAALPRAATTVEAVDASGAAVEFGWFWVLFSLTHNGKLAWTSPASGPPSLLGDAQVAAAEGSEVVVHRFADGAVTQRLALPASSAAGPPSGAFRPFAVGAGLVIAAAGTTLYR